MPIKVTYSDNALKDIKDIYRYICNILKTPQTASNQVAKIFECADNLSYLPKRNKVYFVSSSGQKVRRALVGNYSIFYVFNDGLNTVYIFAVIYNKCSEDTILKKLG